MTVDEWAIRDTARDLANLYRELDAQKYAPPAPRETRVMKPRPGPSSPGNWFAMCLDADMVDHLVEMVCDARNHIEPAYTVGRDGAVLCDWIAWNAQPISELDFAADLHDLMVDQARRLARHLPAESDDQRDAFLSMRSLQSALRARSLECPEATVRSWAHRHQIAVGVTEERRRGYSLVDTLKRLYERLTSGN